jgi:phosphoribosylaminoimidazole-succinocarboxamide synthase
MSAFDVVLPDPIPYKGIVLNQLTLFWMDTFNSLVTNHIKTALIQDFPKALQRYAPELNNRSVIVAKANPLAIECIVRGYLSGSGWKEYLKTGAVCDIKLPDGLIESEQLPEPLFTPSTKAEIGDHDININADQAKELIGNELFEKARHFSLSMYSQAEQVAEQKGIIIADTKFEFGVKQDSLVLIDEVLTPDSSRFWPKDLFAPGKSQPNFDKQYLRDWLTEHWDKTSEPPRLPQEVIDQTQQKYFEAYRKFTGQEISCVLP